jgi:hypothetical protein
MKKYLPLVFLLFFLVSAKISHAQVPTVTGITSSTPDGLKGIGATVSIQISFSEAANVTGTPRLLLETGASDTYATYLSGTGTGSLTFTYTVVEGNVSADLDYASTTALELNGGTIKDLADVDDATLTLVAPGAAGSLGNAKAIVIDGVRPTITGVTSSTGNGLKGIGTNISIQIGFSSNVTVTGTPRLLLETGAVDTYATYASGTGSNSLTFTYTVVEADVSGDLDYASTTALELNGGTIQDAATNDATLTLATPGAANSLGNAKALVIDGVRPTFQSLVVTANNSTATLTFSEPVGRNNDATGNLRKFPDEVEATLTGGTVTLTTYTITHAAPSNTLTVTLTLSGTTNGGETLEVEPGAANEIFDAAGNAMLAAATISQVLNDNKGPTVTNITSSTADDTYGVGTIISIQLTFDEAATVNTGGGTPSFEVETGVTDGTATYASGSGTTTLTFNYNVATGHASGDLNNKTPLAFNGGTIRDAANNNVTLTLPIAAGGLAANKAIVIETTPPSASNVNSSTPNGTYATGVISIQVTYTEVVNVNTGGGTPSFEVETGTVDGVATYVSGTGTNILTFEYTIQTGHNSLDLNNKNLLSLNGGTIKDAAGNDASTTLLTALAGNKAIVINATNPTVSSVSATTANGSYNAGDLLTITVTFNENVEVVGSPQIQLEMGATDKQATYSTGTGTATLQFTYTIAVGDNNTDLDYTGTNALTLNGGTILKAGNALAATLTLPNPGAANSLSANTAIVVDTDDPAVSNVTSSKANGSYSPGELIVVTIMFDEVVNVTGIPRIQLETGATDQYATYTSGTGTNTLSFTYTVQAGDASADLDYVATNSLELNGGTITDAAGNNSALTLAAPGAANSLGANKAIVIDSTPPTVSNVTSPTPNGTYVLAGVVTVTVQFTENVTVTGTPRILLETGATDRFATYAGGSGTNTLSFTYTIQANDVSSDLDYVATNSLQFNGGTIVDPAGNAATLTLVAPGAAGSLGANKAIVIDATVPFVTNVTSTNPSGAYKIAEAITVSVSFNEVVTVIGTPRILLETGTTDRYANYIGGTGTTTLNFSYNIAVGDQAADLDYVATSSFELNSGTIADVSTNPADLTLPNPGAAGSLGANRNIIVDGIRPVVNTVTRLTPVGQITNADNVIFRVVFSEPVVNVDNLDFTVNLGAVTLTTPVSGTTYDVTVGGPGLANANGTLVLTIPNTTTINDSPGIVSPGNAYTANFSSGETYIIDNAPPNIAAVGPFLPADNSNNNSLTTNLVVKFNEDVTLGSGNIYIFRSNPSNLLLQTISVGDAGQVSFNAGTDELTINPILNLPQDARIYIQTDAGIVNDIAGNSYAGITNTTTWNFGMFGTPVFVDVPDAINGALSDFGCVGSTITITGDFLTGVDNITFHGVGGTVNTSSFTVDSETQITVTVPTYPLSSLSGTITLSKSSPGSVTSLNSETIQIGPAAANLAPGTPALINNTVCSSGSITTSAIAIDIRGGVSPYSATYGIGSVSGYLDNTDIIVDPPANGINTYTIVGAGNSVTDVNGCAVPLAGRTGSYAVTQNQRPAVEAGGNVVGQLDYCLDNGLAITLNAATLGNAPLRTPVGAQLWTTNGTGNFNTASLLQPIYTVSPFDILGNSLELTITTTGNPTACEAVADVLVVNFISNAVADPGGTGGFKDFCWNGSPNPAIPLTGSVNGASGVLWTSVTGANAQFTASRTILNPTYTFNAAETAAGQAEVTIEPTGAGACGGTATPVSLIIRLVNIPVPSFAVFDPEVCLNQSNVVYSVGNTPTSTYLWTVPSAGGTTFIGQGNSTILVNWGNAPASYNISVVETNVEGCASNSIQVSSNLNPEPDVIFQPQINHAQGNAFKYRLAVFESPYDPQAASNDTIPDGTIGINPYTVFSGNGVIREKNKWWFDARDLPIANNYVIDAQYTDVNGCVANETEILNVYDGRNQIGNLDIEYCENETQIVSLSPVLEAGDVLRYMYVEVIESDGNSWWYEAGAYYDVMWGYPRSGYLADSLGLSIAPGGDPDGGPFTYNPSRGAKNIPAGQNSFRMVLHYYYNPPSCPGCWYEKSQEVTVFRVPRPSFAIADDDLTACSNAAKIDLTSFNDLSGGNTIEFTSDYDLENGTTIVKADVDGNYAIYPSETTPQFIDVRDSIQIKLYYTFTQELPQTGKGCAATDSTQTYKFFQQPSPVITNAPSNRICVTDKNNADPVSITNWIDDPSYSMKWSSILNPNLSTDTTFTPKAPQLVGVENQFSVVHSVNGCASDPVLVVYEVLDQITFTADRNCLDPTGANPITFTAAYGGGGAILDSIKWYVFRSDSTLYTTPVRTVPSSNVYTSNITLPDNYYVYLQVKSNNDCRANIPNRLVVLPTYNVGGDAFPTYSATFDGNPGGWVAKGAAWEYDLAGSAKRYMEGESAADRMWITNADGLYPANDKSYLYSPCFILDSLNRPMISMKTWTDLVDGFDGVTLQYSIDDNFVEDNANKIWTTLGNFDNGIQSGVNWFNADGIQAKPGEQLINDYGWTGTSSETGWQESKHVLDEVPIATDKVIFRLAFASKDGVRVEDGFAVNDVFIGNRTRTVLIENFTNTSNTATDARGNITLAEADSLKNFNPSGLGTELVKINYHVNFPGIDPFNMENNEDPSARALYYGIDMAPRARLDGQTRTDLGPLFSQWGRAEYNIQTLDLAEASIQIDTTTVGNELMISGNFSPNIDLPNRTILYVAIAEQSVNITLPGNTVTDVLTGETQFEYVLKKLLPTAAGEKYTGLAANVPVSFGPYSYQKTMRHFAPGNNLAIIVFLQDEQTKQVYQSDVIRNIKDPALITGTEDPEYEKGIYVYPNPANHEMNIELPAVVNKPTPVTLYDTYGRVVFQSGFKAGEKTMKISTSTFADGVYMMQLIAPQGTKVSRKIMVKH